MESSDLNSINEVEADRASFLPTKEVTLDTARHFAGAHQEYRIKLPPEYTFDQLHTNATQTRTGDLYQCSRNRLDNGSGSDSAEEEYSPYSSTDNLKYEALAPTGKRQEKHKVREQPPNASSPNNSFENQYMFQSLQTNTEPHTQGPHGDERSYSEATDALVLTGSLNEMSTVMQTIRPQVMPRGEIASPFDDDLKKHLKVVRSANQCHGSNVFEDVDARLVTFFNCAVDWPHIHPSPEQMARAGMIYKGVFTINKGNTVYDMVECYKCGNTLYGFTENDDPVAEHKKYYPNCH